MDRINLFIEERKKQIRVLGVIAALFAFAVIVLASQTKTNVLHIAGTGIKDEWSAGTDIRISSIKKNMENLEPRDVILGGEWDTTEIFSAVGADSSTWLEIEYKETDSLESVFQKQIGSGYVNIYKNDAKLEEMNLYCAEFEEEHYVLEKAKKASLLEQVLPFVVLVLGLMIEYMVVSMILPCFWKNNKRYTFIPYVLLLAGAISLHVSVEIMNSNLFGLGIGVALENILLYFTAMLIIYIITARVSWAVASVSVVWLIFAMANYFVTFFRGLPISWGDFLTLQTAANVVGEYEFAMPVEFCYGLVVFCLLFAVIIYSNRMSDMIKIKGRTLLCIPVFVFVWFISSSGVYFKTMNLWQPKENIISYGLGVNMVSGILNMRLEAPEDYSEERAEKILSSYEEKESDFKPNIIVIMNESFSDMSVFNDKLDNDLYMSYYNSLQEDTIKGTTVSSALGGQTANAEYEFLTGNSMYYLVGRYPYQQYIYKPTLSLPRLLKERGYQTVAIHPYIGSGYNRPSVYSNFEFDSYVDQDDFSDFELVRNTYISDKDSYEKVIEEYEKIQSTSHPAFIFNVTMQNHSKYNDFYAGTEEVVQIPGMEGQYANVEDYLTLIKKSDQALSVLIDYFKKVEEPTILLLFGDHQPYFDEKFYEAFCVDSEGNKDIEYSKKQYDVPFLIWANYDIEEEENVYTSMNYLSALLFEKTGVPLSAYQNYLLELRESIPVISKSGYYDNEGEWHFNGSAEVDEKIEDYWYLEYYHIFKEVGKDK